MNTKPIGILDSGVGGLSVYQEIVTLLPYESTIYIGDNALTPYGRLSEEAIFARSKKLVAFLLERKVKLIVVACNAITVSCIAKLRETFPKTPIIGTVPVVKTAAALSRAKSFGILSTTRTAESTYLKQLIEGFAQGHKVLSLGTDELVPLIERGILEGEKLESVLRKVLVPLRKEHVDTLILGCTHFPFVKKAMQSILGRHVQVLDSGAAIARQVKRVLEGNNALVTSQTPQRSFYTTGDAHLIDHIAKKLLGVTIASTTVVL